MKTIITLLLFTVASCNQPRPLQQECARFTTCASCAERYCGWCDKSTGVGKIGCYSLQEPRVCGPATVYIPDCSSDVTDPANYGTRRGDGGP